MNIHHQLRRPIAALGIFLISAFACAQNTGCSQFNVTYGPFNYGNFDTKEHSDGSHGFADVYGGSCTYVGAQGACVVTAKATSQPGSSESGHVVGLNSHYIGTNQAEGTASSNGGAASADTEAALAVRSCLFSCSVAVAISGSGNGSGFTVSFPADALWGDKQYYKADCLAKAVGGGGGGGGNGGGSGGCCQPGACSPIVIDTTGGGFHFTDPAKQCILFDIKGNHHYGCFSWPVHGSGNAWLVLDRNGDGEISNGKELFGNFTPQKNHPNPAPNGFLALAEYDLPENGGNLDTVIDSSDAIWSKLRLWIDEHCYRNPDQPCVSRPSELHTLEEKGIRSLGIVYSSGDQQDSFGNLFRFYAPINIEKGRADKQTSFDGRRAFDVYLAMGHPNQTQKTNVEANVGNFACE